MPDDADSANLINNKFKELLMATKSKQEAPLPNNNTNSNSKNLANTNIKDTLSNEVTQINNIHEEIRKGNLLKLKVPFHIS